MGGPLNRPALSENRLLLLLAAVQFTQIMDFMIMMPLGPQLQHDLHISVAEFGALISSFAISSGVVGLMIAPYSDRFDRRKLLLICYAGFALATLACGLATHHFTLLIARILCGAFGGVSGATIMAIVADVVPPERRARGMGIIMTAFSLAAALGVPFGLKLAEWWKWEGPFFAIAAVAAVAWIGLIKVLPPVRGHLTEGPSRSLQEFGALLRDSNAWVGLLLMATLIFGHFTVVPFLPTHLERNTGLPKEDLFLIYLTGGIVTMVASPLIGKLADHYGRFRVFTVLVSCACVVVYFLTSAGHMPLWLTLVLAGCFFTFAGGRFVPAQATISLAVPPSRRGAYMSLAACARDIAAGLTTALGGRIVVEQGDKLLHYDRLGLVAIGVSLISIFVFRFVKPAEGKSMEQRAWGGE